MKCHLVTIGNEILSGSTLDTNSHFIAQKLFDIGITVALKITISDDKESIENTLKNGLKNAELVIYTGGLGPTKDDITKETITHFFNDKLIENKQALEHIEQLFAKKNRVVNAINKKQALVPSRSKVIINEYGTAPCMWIQKENTTFIFLPGVPYETKNLINTQIIPLLKSTYKLPYIVSNFALVTGIPESILSEKLNDWENNLHHSLQLAYLPTGSRIKVKLTKSGENKEAIEQEISTELAKLESILSSSVLSTDSKNPEDLLIEFLIQNKKTVAVAESCTGGKLAYNFVKNAGSSAYFLGSITSYATKIKKNVLHISDEIIEKNTAVSKECAEQMAKNIATLMKSDLGISTTGIAGPDSDENNTEVGIAYVGICFNGKTDSEKFFLPNMSREEFIIQITNRAIEFAYKKISSIN
ncbi:MAG: CinA family nicotinamide mononucleotide deamidase-related protein [Flavobacteriales bacterium]|nr:CinA family nicotinamide mononucleotide deamidase-related protein [Flavobacteriales bacterium]